MEAHEEVTALQQPGESGEAPLADRREDIDDVDGSTEREPCVIVTEVETIESIDKSENENESEVNQQQEVPANCENDKQEEVTVPDNEETEGVPTERDVDSEDFFEKISSIRIRYDDSEKKTIKEFKFSDDVVDGTIADQLWPTLGGWNVDDLYGEVLYALLHTLKGNDQSESDSLVAHLQQAFHIDNDKHKKLLDAAREKQAPPLVLNLEVIEAKGLKGKDVNGLSDPFCTLFISPKQKHNTSMKPETLNPVWREYFSLPITSHQDEVLSLEVWDYDPEETVSDKMKRFGEVKSTRGLRVLMKEIAMTASTGKQQHEFLGCLKVPIKTIPGGGFDKWFNLESKNGNGHKKKGEIHLRLALGAEKDKKVAAQEYRHVLHLLLVHELDEENIQPHVWDGQFSKYSEFILNQLRWQGGLLPHDIDLAKWLVYTRVQCEHPLNAKLFPPIFQAVIDQAKNIDDDEMRKFWFASEKLVENFSAFVRNIHQCFLTNSNTASQAYHMLKTLGMLKQHLTDTTGMKKEILGKISSELVKEKVENGVCLGAEDMVRNIIKSDSNPDESEVENMIKIGQLLIADLRKGLESLNSVFKELLGIDFFEVTYRVYDREYVEVVTPVVSRAVKELKPFGLSGNDGPEQDKRMSSGTVLFELYLAIKQFADLSSNLDSENDLNIQGSYHNWFHSGVAQWLDIAWYKALKRIQKAVELDTLHPVTDGAQITSSAVDTAHIFHQIQIFWDQLSWPEVEGQYTFIAKILDDLCLCIIKYAEIMCKKVEDLERKQDEKYEVSDELCLAINNIEYVGLEMKPISEKLHMKKILEQMKIKNGAESTAQCARTLSTVMQNATESVNNKMYDILASVGYKMEPVIYRLLLEGSETENEEEGIGKLMKYLDKNLIKLKRKMTPTGFDKVFDIIWENASLALKDLIRTNLEKRRPPEFFQRIHNMMQILLDFFYPDGVNEVDAAQNSNIREVQDLIGLHGARTSDLILKYAQERYKKQTETKKTKGENGMITFRATYCDDIETLKIEILNCRQLKPCDSNGLCDPFVKVQLLPSELYPIATKKTKVKKKTLCPLFDEMFIIPLPAESMSLGGLLYLSVKDHDLFGRNDFLGEAYMPLESIPFTPSNTKLQDLPQIHLSLSLPTTEGLLILQTLENRTWDQDATQFAKKQRAKMENCVNGGNASP